jgi:hypothetical protein
MLERKVHLTLTEPDFLVIYKLLYNLRLGGNNIFEDSITELMIELDECGAESYYNAAASEFGEPRFKFEFNDDEGFVINVLEE